MGDTTDSEIGNDVPSRNLNTLDRMGSANISMDVGIDKSPPVAEAMQYLIGLSHRTMDKTAKLQGRLNAVTVPRPTSHGEVKNPDPELGCDLEMAIREAHQIVQDINNKLSDIMESLRV